MSRSRLSVRYKPCPCSEAD
uniref:Uncharacterized protein n=1 Tax=Anguilla anguilla TaxID=7936 RepID=A0A0E9R6I4_ANGAN